MQRNLKMKDVGTLSQALANVLGFEAAKVASCSEEKLRKSEVIDELSVSEL